MLRGLPASAAVRSRVTAAGRRSVQRRASVVPAPGPCRSPEAAMPAAAMPAVARIIGVAGEPGDPGRPGPFPARWRQQRTHRRHEPCVPRFGCLAAARAISRLAPRPARACLCANLWMTCAKARRICAQCGDNGGDSRLAAPLEGPLPARTLSAPCALAEN